MKTSKEDKQWFTERCGELLIMDIPGNISTVVDEALERHGLQNTPQNRKTVSDAYRTANPGNAKYAKKTYHPFYKRGKKKNKKSIAQNSTFLGHLAIDREHSIKAVRDAIVNAYKTGENCAIDPKHLTIFDKGISINELYQTDGQYRRKNRITESDEDCFGDEPLESFEMDGSETETDEMSSKKVSN